MSTDAPVEQKKGPKWPSQKQEKKANYTPLRGRGYTKSTYSARWYAKRKRKRKLVRQQRRQQRRR